MRYVKERIAGRLEFAIRELECAERLCDAPSASCEESDRVIALYEKRMLNVERLSMMEKVADMNSDELTELVVASHKYNYNRRTK